MPEFLAVPSLVEEDLILPIAGADKVVRKYHIPAATAEQFLMLQVLDIRNKGVELDGADLARVSQIATLDDLLAYSLGPTAAQEMVTDGVSAADLRRAIRTASQWNLTGGDTEAALAVWSGKAQTPTTGSQSSSEILSAEAGDVESEAPKASTRSTSSRPATSNGSKRARTSAGRTSGNAST